jgi:hypothetical protein
MSLIRDLGAHRARSTVIAFALLVLTLTFSSSALAAQAPVPLGNAASFGALDFTAMTNSGLDTVVHGDVGSSTSIDVGVTHPGFGGYGAGTTQLADAQASLLAAFLFAAAQTPTGPDITGMNLAGKVLTPGVYNSTGALSINGPVPLTLDGGGNPDAVFIFQAAASGDLTVTPTSSVTYTNGAQPCNVFWKVQSAFLQNTGFTFVGTILALTQITLTNNITVEGRVLARNADVTFIHDTINRPAACTTAADAAANASAAAANAAAAAAATAAANAAIVAQAAAVAKAAEDAKAAAVVKAAADAKAAAAVAAAAKATAAKAAATKAAAAKKAAAVKARAHAISTRTIARPARRHVGLTG